MDRRGSNPPQKAKKSSPEKEGGSASLDQPRRQKSKPDAAKNANKQKRSAASQSANAAPPNAHAKPPVSAISPSAPVSPMARSSVVRVTSGGLVGASPPPVRAMDSLREVREVKDRAVQCDIFNVETLTWFFLEGVFCDLVLVGQDGTQVFLFGACLLL